METTERQSSDDQAGAYADLSAEWAARLKRLEYLEPELRSAAAEVNAAQARFLELLAEYDSARGWGDWGARSGISWLSNQCGHGPSLARAELSLAHALEQLPHTRAAMARGALSMDKARALATVATPQTEAELLGFALETTANQLRRALAAARRALSSDEALRLRRARFLDSWWDEEGCLAIRGKLSPEEGALFRRGPGRGPRDALPRAAGGRLRRRPSSGGRRGGPGRSQRRCR